MSTFREQMEFLIKRNQESVIAFTIVLQSGKFTATHSFVLLWLHECFVFNLHLL